MDLRHLRCFVAVVEEGSFTRAAERLGIAQPTASTAVTRLEDELATRLLDRSSHPVRPTRTGAALLEHAVGVLTAMDGLHAAVRSAGRAPGDLRVGLFCGGAGPVTPRLLQLLGATSGRQVQVDMVRVGEQVPALLGGEVDVVVSTGPFDDPRVHAVRLFSVPRVAVLGRHHPLAGSRTLAVRQLLDQPFLPESATGTGVWADWWNLVPERGGRQPRRWPAAAGTDPRAFLHQHALGPTVGLAPGYVVDCVPAESMGVCYIPVPDLSPAAVFALIRANDADLRAAVQAAARGLDGAALASGPAAAPTTRRRG